MGLYLGTTSAGLEASLRNELKKLEAQIVMESTFHGGVVFSTKHSPEVIAKLRSLDSIYAFLDSRADVPHDKESGMAYFENLPSLLEWGPALETYNQWRRFLTSEHAIEDSPCASSLTESRGQGAEATIGTSSDLAGSTMPKLDVSFRVTCERICHKLKKHGFSSTDAAVAMGAGIHLKFGWPANMRCFDCMDSGQWHPTCDPTYIQLYARRQYRVALVRTALKPSTAYALLQLADIQTGHLVLDPMCGGGTIPLEAADWLGSRIAALGGDKDRNAVDAARTNSSTGQGGCPTGGCDVVRWDACHLPLRDGCVDRIICDMPFGVRCGSVKMREQLSPRVAREVARLLPLGTGKAVIMAQSKAMKLELLSAQKDLFSVVEHLHVEMEGIRVDVMVVRRTEQPLPPIAPSNQVRRKQGRGQRTQT